ncbi:MAG: metallophosphoesterase [Thermoleophilia bacterium]|nr:metallophosphoesterase [Thermoleophilia bacterium]
MKLLALYDIHANVDALEAVLADPRAADVDVVLVGGDAVPGPFAGATLDRLGGLDVPVHWIRGNGEREVAEAVGAAPPADDDMAARTAAITADELGEARARVLGRLPLTLEIDGVLYCHATPRRDDEIATRLSSLEHWTAVLEGVGAGTVVAGHTHQTDDREVAGRRFVNAGSVGMPYEGDGAARWLLVDDGVPTPYVTEYDAEAAGRRILDAGWPDERSVSASLVEPVPALEVTEFFEALVS